MKLFRKAILIVHGFAGGVYDQEKLYHELELKWNYDVFTFTLPGHEGVTDRDIKYTEWISKAESEVEFLINHGYQTIYVIGHSMGCVIASYLASKYKEIKKLVLVAPAFRHIGFEDGTFSVKNSIVKGQKILSQYGFKLVASRFFKLPTTYVIEFRKIVKENEETCKNVHIPTLIIRGTSDEIVPEEAINLIYEQLDNPYKKIVHLENITHDVFRESLTYEAIKLIEDFLHNKNAIKKMPDMIENVNQEKKDSENE